MNKQNLIILIILCVSIVATSVALVFLYRSRKMVDPRMIEEKEKINYRIKIVWILWGLLVGILILLGLYLKFYKTPEQIAAEIMEEANDILQINPSKDVVNKLVEQIKSDPILEYIRQTNTDFETFVKELEIYKQNVPWTQTFFDVFNEAKNIVSNVLRHDLTKLVATAGVNAGLNVAQNVAATTATVVTSPYTKNVFTETGKATISLIKSLGSRIVNNITSDETPDQSATHGPSRIVSPKEPATSRPNRHLSKEDIANLQAKPVNKNMVTTYSPLPNIPSPVGVSEPNNQIQVDCHVVTAEGRKSKQVMKYTLINTEEEGKKPFFKQARLDEMVIQENMQKLLKAKYDENKIRLCKTGKFWSYGIVNDQNNAVTCLYKEDI